MALPTSIHTLLSGNVVEWARIEFKETWKPEASLKTITAFANDVDNWGGGYVILGVGEDENGRPKKPYKGIKLSEVDRTMKDLLNKCKLISPEYLPIVEPVDYDENTKLIVVWCPGGPVRPYHSPLDFKYEKGKAIPTKDSICWIRKMASTVKPSNQDLSDLYNMANHVPFDDQICHKANMTDLNITLIRAYLKEVGSDLYEESSTMDFNKLCAQMEIANSIPEYTKPKNVGLLFFSLEPEKYIPCAQIDVVEFADGAGGDHIEEHIFRGPLHQQLRDALRYISNNILQERIVKYPDRAEADRYFNYPYPAIEEALANAVYHKSYSIREPVEVRVESDRIEILSYPGPDRSVTVDALKSFNVLGRRYRNRRIGDYLKELHLTEGRNTGFRKILRALDRNGSPLPEFITDDEHTFFITRLYIREGFNEEKQTSRIPSDHSAEQIDSLNAETKQLEKQLETLKTEKKQLEKQLENSDSEFKQLEKQPENSDSELKKLEKQPENSDSELKQLEKQLEPSSSETNQPEVQSNDDITNKNVIQKRIRSENILLLIESTPTISQVVLAKKMGLTVMEVRTIINSLRKEGIISRKGSARGGYWIIEKK